MDCLPFNTPPPCPKTKTLFFSLLFCTHFPLHEMITLSHKDAFLSTIPIFSTYLIFCKLHNHHNRTLESSSTQIRNLCNTTSIINKQLRSTTSIHWATPGHHPIATLLPNTNIDKKNTRSQWWWEALDLMSRWWIWVLLWLFAAIILN